jgi:hypothetical protein
MLDVSLVQKPALNKSMFHISFLFDVADACSSTRLVFCVCEYYQVLNAEVLPVG